MLIVALHGGLPAMLIYFGTRVCFFGIVVFMMHGAASKTGTYFGYEMIAQSLILNRCFC